MISRDKNRGCISHWRVMVIAAGFLENLGYLHFQYFRLIATMKQLSMSNLLIYLQKERRMTPNL